MRLIWSSLRRSEIPHDCTGRAVRLESKSVLRADDDPAGFEHADESGLEGHDRSAPVFVLDGASLPTLDDAEVGAGSDLSDGAIVDQGGVSGGDRDDWPDKVL